MIKAMHNWAQQLARLMSLLLVVGAATALTGCAGRGGPVPYNVPLAAPDQERTVGTAGLQRIAPMDKLQITTFQVEELTGEFTVDGSGVLNFPLVGAVQAQGKTPAELGTYLAQRLGQRYLRNPNVQVSITEASQQTVTIDGAVNQPGAYPVQGGTTLMRALALARGMSGDANPSRVVVFRTVNGQRMAAAFDMQQIRRSQAEDPAIYGNDVVVVDGSRGRALLRDVLSTLPIIGIFRPF